MSVNTRPANRRGMVPVGTIVAFYDFNAALTFDTKTWAYCDGSVVADADSPLNTFTLPDLANRYLVGFGVAAKGSVTTLAGAPTAGGLGYVANDILTITTGNADAKVRVVTVGGGGIVTAVSLIANGSGYSVAAGQATSGGSGVGCTVNITAIAAASDMGTAAWATAPVGENSHLVDIRHTHYFDHIHSMRSHYHNATGLSGGATGTINITASGDHDHNGRNYGMTTTSGSDEQSWNYRINDDGIGWVTRTGGSRHISVDSGSNDEGQHGHTISSDTHIHATGDFSGHTAGPSTANTDVPSVTSYTNSSLSYSQTVQPQSVRVRWLIRIA